MSDNNNTLSTATTTATATTLQQQSCQSTSLSEMGLYGLAVMGQNFALNMASKGISVAVGNRSPAKVDLTVTRAKHENTLASITGCYTIQEFVASIQTPRRVVILVQAGKPVDDTIANLAEYMDAGDVIIDGGNEWFPNTIRRGKELMTSKGIQFIGMGISGGEEGARNGPSLMPGGPREAYDLIEPVLNKCAAQVDGMPCSAYLGPIGAGNYVKMVHNGIEYGDMQLIGEVYDVLKQVCGMSNEEMAKLFATWNTTELDSYLIEITSKILGKKDDVTSEGYVVDYVLDKTGMKGTGRWTIQEAAERNVAAPTMAASLDARYISGRKDERVAASKVLTGPTTIPNVDPTQVVEDLAAALYASKICSYAQGLNIIEGASKDHDWNVNLATCANLWRGGCIIRAKLLGQIQQAYENNPTLANLMVDPAFAADLNARQAAWRRIVTLCVASGISCPALSGSLQYYDSYRRASLPANLIQAQRDFFGGHTYQRIDREGVYHTAWTDAHKDIGDIESRTAGENIEV